MRTLLLSLSLAFCSLACSPRSSTPEPSHPAPSVDRSAPRSSTSLSRSVHPGLPHAEALRIVLRDHASEIADLDAAHFPSAPNLNGDAPWWFDTTTRSFSVTRPFAPGYIDSTHMFRVDYIIDGKTVASWTIDTSANSADSQNTSPKR